LQRRLVDLDKGGVEDLAQAQQLQDLADLGRDAVDAADADHQRQLGLRVHKEVALGARRAARLDQLALRLGVLGDVGLSALEDRRALLLGRLLLHPARRQRLDAQLVLRLPLLQHALRHEAANEARRSGA
jgi:hypothetical protein